VGLPRLRPLPGILLVVTVLAELGAVGLSWGLESAWDTLFNALFTLLTVGTGVLILSRHPRHAVGWLLCVLGLANALMADLPQGWGLRAAAEGWAGGPAGEWLGLWAFFLQTPVLVAILLLFPSGHLPDRRWSYVVWLSVAGTAIVATGWALDPDTGQYFVGGRNPYAVPGLPTDTLFRVGVTLVAVAMVAALVAAVNRFRRSSGVERQQMKWFALSSGFLVVALLPAGPLWTVTPLVHPLPVIALTVWPVAIGVAILRYRLYDVDLVISRAFTGAVLTVVLALVYVGSTLVIGEIAGGGSPWATAVSTLLAAAAFKVLHQRVQRRVDSRFRPERHAALSRVGEFLEALRAEEVEPEQVVEVLRSALGDPTLELRFMLQPDEPLVDERGRPVPDGLDGARESFAVERGGITLGQVVWLPRTEEQRALLPSVVAAAGLAIEMARLRVELRRRLEEVEASRARLAAVADQERHRLERDLHDGAQQRLVSIGLALRHAQHQIGSDSGEASKTLDGAVAEVAATIDELRELAHGLRPTALQAGLGPALRELVSRVPVAVEVAATPDRYPPDIEAAAYFVACEGLANAVKHAGAERIALDVARHDSRLVVSVADDGMGGADADAGSGLLGLSDRVAAYGGTLHIDSVRGRGTRITAELPCVS
jgi:signal transduction histidine kinase